MMQTAIRRILTALVQVFAVATIVFFLMHSMSGNPARLMLEIDGGAATEEQVQALTDELGLDKPLSVQYVDWIRGLVTMNTGNSYYYKEPVADFIAKRLPATIELATLSLLLAVLLGISCGIVSALRHGKPTDTVVTGLSVFGFSIPNFVLGTILILIFGLTLGILPTSGSVKLSRGVGMHFRYLVLPAVTLALGMAASIARITRSSLMDEINREYVQTLRAKGLSPWHIVLGHSLKNAFAPILTVIGLQFGSLLGGTCVIERIFNWPGLSSLIVESVQHRDYPITQTAVVIIAAIYILINLLVELSLGLIDPRIKKGGKA